MSSHDGVKDRKRQVLISGLFKSEEHLPRSPHFDVPYIPWVEMHLMPTPKAITVKGGGSDYPPCLRGTGEEPTKHTGLTIKQNPGFLSKEVGREWC